ncbi:MAG: hypothetical protein EOM01_09245 [Spirochaetia bacterium]|nr:hypothetical protein [Spirochaetia bacterium]
MLGKKEAYGDKLARERFGVGILMPGYTVLVDGEEKKEWDNPTQAEINAMDTPFLAKALDLFWTFKVCGLPWGKGPMYERATVVQIIKRLEAESKRYEAWYSKHYADLKEEED